MNRTELWLLVIVWKSLVAVPVVTIVPLLIAAAPPLVIRGVAVFALGAQIVPAIYGFAAALAVLGDGVIEPRFGFLDSLAAMFAVVGTNPRSRHQEQESTHGQKSSHGVYESSAMPVLLFRQGFLHSG